MVEYASTSGGGLHGSCFHMALHVWALRKGQAWRVAVGVVAPNPYCRARHLHAWLEDGQRVYSPVTDHYWRRVEYYDFVGVEPQTVRLINPRRILRAVGRARLEREGIQRDAVRALLDTWGPWRIEEGGVLPA